MIQAPPHATPEHLLIRRHQRSRGRTISLACPDHELIQRGLGRRGLPAINRIVAHGTHLSKKNVVTLHTRPVGSALGDGGREAQTYTQPLERENMPRSNVAGVSLRPFGSAVVCLLVGVGSTGAAGAPIPPKLTTENRPVEMQRLDWEDDLHDLLVLLCILVSCWEAGDEPPTIEEKIECFIDSYWSNGVDPTLTPAQRNQGIANVDSTVALLDGNPGVLGSLEAPFRAALAALRAALPDPN